jgi:H+/Cl- antiporter ClcA
VAGGAAGLAAAFNTPLAGVTFAIEELTVDYFASVKDFMVMAIIMSGDVQDSPLYAVHHSPA